MKNNVLKVLLVGCLVLMALDAYIIFKPAPVHVKKPKVTDAIVRLVTRGATFCTGTVLSNTTVLTAAHCVVEQREFSAPEIRKNIEIRPADNSAVGAFGRVTTVRYQLDQAIITGDFSEFHSLRFIPDVGALNTEAIKRSKLTACGYPLGGKLFCATIYFKDLENFMWKVKGETLLPGMSGGPVLLSNGDVVATNVAVEDDHSIVSPIYNLDDSIEEE